MQTKCSEIIVSECNVERFTQSISNLYDRISNKSIADYVMSHQLANSYFSVPVGALHITEYQEAFVLTKSTIYVAAWGQGTFSIR